ncbi:MAG: AAA family ATPase [Prevotella sp.]|nr:AAA family ATPase [Candidatus Prevotella equi]
MPQQKYSKYIDILKENQNLVLTGAPGTGKTFMAHGIAKEMNAEVEFVQFHPSYDYTDFVEGLRPIEKTDGQMGFERKDGVFKEFCKKAAKNLEDSEKTLEELYEENSFEEKYKVLIDRISNDELTYFELKSGKLMEIVEISDNNNIVLKTKDSGSNKLYIVSFDRLAKLAKVYTDSNSINTMPNISVAISDVIGGCHTSAYWAVLREIYKQESYHKTIATSKILKKDFVFIIDEINRGEASKIFGELFYAIDPGYRGKKDIRVKTQYQNLIPDTDVFAEGFYVPENVYILATMNDIDRSVESMDFAMRRRFTWMEVTPKDTESMLDELASYAQKAKDTMARINALISETDGLGDAYQVGPSYFLKLKGNGGNFDKLWRMNIEPLLKEYLRGFRKSNEIISKLKDAYNNTDTTSSNNNENEVLDE